jgi:hypothetical protein
MLAHGEQIEPGLVGEPGGGQNVLQALTAPPSAARGVRSPNV